MDKINLKEILNRVYDKEYRSSYKTEYPEQCIFEAMKEACRQVLEIAADNASVDKIHLEEILFRHVDSLKDGSPIRNLLSSNEVFQNDLFDFFMNLMKDVCKETLYLAAENAKIKENFTVDDKAFVLNEYVINKQSILDTINEVE